MNRVYGWQLTEDLVYEGADDTFTVPAGFETDFGSVPWIVSWLVPSTGDGMVGAFIVHDYLYDFGRELGVSRADADGIMRRIMGEEGVTGFRRYPAWAGVRIGGWWRYSP